jgi:tRNA (uracil-5-)-methyltransferase TRM9
VDPIIKDKLLDINHQFYQTFAEHFSATRQHLQPGVSKIIHEISPYQNILDVGCGNGNVWHELVRLGHRGAYVGLDFSPELLRLADLEAYEYRPGLQGPKNPLFILVDLSEENWELSIPAGPFERIFAFAVLHHLPGQDLRIKILDQVRHQLASGGKLVLSVWQFLNSSRLRERIREWSMVGLSEDQVDPGDYLLDWRSGGIGLRYVHHFNEKELKELAVACGFRVVDAFSSDGKGGDLGLYQIWELEK